MKVYPNPVIDELTVSISIPLSAEILVEVLDPQGRIMQQKELFVDQEELIRIDMSNYIEGLYFIRILDGNRLSVVKVIKE